jgi:hypothetical protein
MIRKFDKNEEDDGREILKKAEAPADQYTNLK